MKRLAWLPFLSVHSAFSEESDAGSVYNSHASTIPGVLAKPGISRDATEKNETNHLKFSKFLQQKNRRMRPLLPLHGCFFSPKAEGSSLRKPRGKCLLWKFGFSPFC